MGNCNAPTGLILLLMELRYQPQFTDLTVCMHTEEQKHCEREPCQAPNCSLQHSCNLEDDADKCDAVELPNTTNSCCGLFYDLLQKSAMYMIHRNTRSLSTLLLIHKLAHETFNFSRTLIGFFIHNISFLSLPFFHYLPFYSIYRSSHLLHSFNLISL